MRISLFLILFVTVLPFKLRIGALQMSSVGLTPKEKFLKSVEFIQAAARNDTEIVVLPSDWNDYTATLLSDYQKVASENSIAICVTYTNSNSNETFRKISLVDANGKIVLEYEKRLADVAYQSEDFSYAKISIGKGGEEVGIGIMFDEDVLFPETTRVLMIKGAELFLVMGNYQVNDLYYDFLQTRALENANAIIFSNPSSSTTSNGRSYFSSYKLKPEFLDEKTEGVLYVDFDVDLLRKFRNEEAIFGDAFRRPHSYLPLCYDKYNPEVTVAKRKRKNSKDVVLKIGLAQMNPKNTVEENKILAEKFVRSAAEQNVDVVLFPELWSVGYFTVMKNFPNPTDIDVYDYLDHAISKEDEFVKFFQDLARELNIAISVTFMQRMQDNLSPRNSLSLIDRHGTILYTYSKMHNCVFCLEINHSPGSKMFSATLDTQKGEVVVGSFICYDRESIEPSRMLVQQGVELVIAANACDLSDMMITQLGVRATENAFGLAICNPAGEQPWFNGNSVIYDHLGETITHATSEEGLFVGEVNISKVREFRETKLGKALTQIVNHPELCKLHRSELFNTQNYYKRTAGATT